MRRVSSILILLVLVPAIAVGSDLDRLAKDLKSRDPETRARAAKSLRYQESPQAVELLAQALSDREPKVRSEAASSLWKLGDFAKAAIPALRNTLADSDPYVVACAAGALISMDVPQAEVADVLRGVLKRGDPYDRFLAARGLTGVEPAGNLVPAFLGYLHHYVADETDVLERNDNVKTATKALEHLGETQDRTQIEPLMTHLRGAPAPIIPPILNGLGKLKPPPDHFTDTLVAQLDSKDISVRTTALHLLRSQQAAADIRKWAPAVAPLTKDPNAEIRGWAIGTLQDGKGLAYEAFGAVLQMISSERDDKLRARAADVAGDIANTKYPIDTAIKSSMAKAALPVLTNAIQNDPNQDVRRKALGSLTALQLEPSEIVPIVARAAVQEKDANFKTDAILMLRNFGHDAAPVMPTIEPLTHDPDPEVARIAKTVISEHSHPVAAHKATRAPAAAASAPAASDPAAREKAFALLREKDVRYTEGDFARALRELDKDVVTAFLDAGMSPNQRIGGELPLQFIFDSDHECGAEMKSLVKLLLVRGADAAAADDNGNTVLMTSSKSCDAEVIKMLLKGGAKANAKNAMGFTAIEDAITSGNTSAATALVAAGARLTPEKAKSYRETYKKKPKVMEIIEMASKK